MEATKLWEAMDSNYWDMKQPVESLRKKRMKQEQRWKTERFPEEEKLSMKAEWKAYTRTVVTNRLMTTFGKGGPSWDDVVWREVLDVDANLMLEDKPKEIISKRESNKTLGRKMKLNITMYTDTKHESPAHRGSGSGDFPEDHVDGLGPSQREPKA